jgi:hypothetical protein
MRALALVVLSIASHACGGNREPVDCHCPPGPEHHPAGPVPSLAGGRILTVAAETVEVREFDGSVVQYRFAAHPRKVGGKTLVRCGVRPAGFGRRSFEIASTSSSSAVLRVRTAPGNRFVAHSDALVVGVWRSQTTRAPDGSLIEVQMDVPTSLTTTGPITVSIPWTLETPTGETIDEQVAIDLPGQPPTLPDDIDCK